MAESYSLEMLELLVRNAPSARALLPKEQQIAVFGALLEKYCLTPTQLGQKLDVHVRTLSDWRRGRASIPVVTLIKLIKGFNVELPQKMEVVDRYWYTKLGAHLGGVATFKKYGGFPVSEIHRKKQWRKWWNKIGKHKQTFIGKRMQAKSLRESKNVAELVGIILGDGHLDTYQLTVTLNARDDCAYAQYVCLLLEESCGVKPSIVKRSNMNAAVVRLSRVGVSEALVKLGLKYGNKVRQQVDIPVWIKKSVHFSKACIRGLWDTDGCFYEEVHRKRGCEYRYPRLSLVSHSIPLLRSVASLLNDMDFSSKIRNNRSVNLETRADIVRYFRIIGSNNQKHLTRYSKFIHGEGCESGLFDLS